MVDTPPLELDKRLQHTDRILMPWGRHFEMTRGFLALWGVSLIFDQPENGGAVSVPGRSETIPFDTMRDNAIPGEVSDNDQRIMGFGCHHQYVESRAELTDDTRYAHAFPVPGARFVVAARREEKTEILQRLEDGVITNNDTEYIRTTRDILLDRPDLYALDPKFVRKGTSEWRGRLSAKTRTITALTQTQRTLRGHGLDIVVEGLGDVMVDAWWRDVPVI